ncbi:MAG: hypothetical protein O3C23_01675 [bacterium]|nr:hypothetical protein [bacterium]
MENNGENVTIDALARMVAKGFTEGAKAVDVTARFDAVDKRLDRIENF